MPLGRATRPCAVMAGSSTTGCRYRGSIADLYAFNHATRPLSTWAMMESGHGRVVLRLTGGR